MTLRISILATLLVAVSAAPAGSASLPVRTYATSLGVNGASANGASTRPAISASGNRVVFDSTASNLALDPNGAVRDVFLRDVRSNSTQLISQAPGGHAADGPSSHGVIGGEVVVFQSGATNLVPGDRNGATDIFVRGGNGPVVRVSVAANGGDPNGASTDADVSADGRMVVFTSLASNLVPGDVNGESDVFVRDLRTGETRRVSESGGVGGEGASGAPAISPDGRYVSFASHARNLIDNDGNGMQDVFLADLERGSIQRVSVGRGSRAQNRSVIAPFWQISDVSRNGREVVFDSDATNLVRGDRNRDTDVFLRDVRRRITIRVSVDQFGYEADNDSFNPTITPNGRFIAFESFATRLAFGDGPKEDVFVYDRRVFAPSVVSVGHRGQTRARERVRQLLQRPRMSDNGRLIAFTSTAGNLVPGDDNRAEDVFLRVTTPPKARIRRGPGTTSSRRPVFLLGADDRAVRDFLCHLDGVRIPCRRRTRLPRLAPGRHELVLTAGGPGMLFDLSLVRRRFVVR